HRRPADVDLLDTLVDAGAGVDGLGERVEVDHHQLEGGDPEIGQRRNMFGFALIGEQTGVHVRMQRLHPAVEDLGEAGDLLDWRDGNTGARNGFGGRTRRHDVDACVVQAAGQLGEAGLVVDTDQCAPDRPAAVVRSHPRVAFPPVQVTPRVASASKTSTSSRRSTTLIRSCRVASSSSSRTGTGCWARIGPVSVPASTRCTVQPVTLTPYARASATARAPGKAGSNAGWVFTMRPGNRERNCCPRIFMKPADTTRSGSCAAVASVIAASHASRSA